ncbi:NAD(P)/FAD-dependent oxidoreductase [Brumimicrobium aurantiacum]|uniref:NADH:ubiquinone reductase (non-electrogenic) n=1 Tax=Brumimicrobium aurantiacum TaxID=1737063 RepID=A0A3E1EZ34_9FLAO|nr:NAD(P)/FAD-dependent oxidoreductase [Brumimicrobium aurantiacum]RFC54829.1 NAD(P)/FAD-dependent oxidoreductase [Brumimicrobium aurantiacum]
MKVENNKNTIRLPETELPRIVVLGGGFAGLSLAKKFKNQDVQLVVLDKNNFHQFQPLLYQVATSGIVPDSIAFPFRKQFKTYNNVYFRMANVERIDKETKCVYTDIGMVAYDYLIIATGSDTNFFGLEDVQMHSLGMKSIQEALDIRSLLLQRFEKAVVTDDDELRNALTNFAVVGGGPAGVETVGAIAEFKKYILPKDYPDLDTSIMTIYLIESNERLLSGMSDKASKNAIKYLEDLGVKVHLKTRVTSYDGENIKTADDQHFKAKSMIWTAGVRGNVPEGIEEDSLARGNRLVVNEYSEVKGCSDVYAIGDIASMSTKDYPNGHPMVAQVAIQQGDLLAKNILNKWKGKELEKFVYNDKGSMATVGKKKAVADIGRFKFGGYFAWLLWSVVHLMSISGFKNKLFVGINWIWSYFTYDKGNRLIMRRYKKSKRLD